MLIRLAAVLLLLPLFTASCSTSLGYVPHYVAPDEMTKRTAPLRPSYPDVQDLGYRQLRGYLISAGINKYAVYGAALTALGAGAAMAALNLFAPGSGHAIAAIGLGGGALTGIQATMQNDPKAIVYTRGANLVATALLNSDKRAVTAGAAFNGEAEALCLRDELLAIDALVGEHLLLLIPEVRLARFTAAGTDPGALGAVARNVHNYDNLLAVPAICAVPFAPYTPPAPPVVPPPAAVRVP